MSIFNKTNDVLIVDAFKNVFQRVMILRIEVLSFKAKTSTGHTEYQSEGQHPWYLEIIGGCKTIIVSK